MGWRSEVLEQAAEIIEEYGWHKGSMGDERVGYCLLGATDRASFELITGSDHVMDYLLDNPLYAVVHARLESTLWFTDRESIIGLNDRVLENKDDAIQVLMDGAKYWRDKGE